MPINSHEAKEARDIFFAKIDPNHHFNTLFNHLPRILFFVKNDKGQLLFANDGLVQLYGFKHEAEFIGRDDFELLPSRLAEKYRADDLKIMASGQPMLKIVELFLNQQGIPEWYLTNKFPVFSKDGQVIGVMGTIVEYRGEVGKESPFSDISNAVEYLRAHYRETISLCFLSKKSSLSLRQFDRKFQAIFNTSPHQFQIKLRVHAACELLRENSLAISEIATELGFTDQSAMARHFKKNMGFSPLQYRHRYR